tara:strand:- start:71 stop:319 length:249 start_codon:yes stop_codon:yes gene_type:complete
MKETNIQVVEAIANSQMCCGTTCDKSTIQSIVTDTFVSKMLVRVNVLTKLNEDLNRLESIYIENNDYIGQAALAYIRFEEVK